MAAFTPDDLTSKTHRWIEPLIVDNVYKSSPPLMLLIENRRHKFEGGYNITVPIISAELRGGSIPIGGTFDVSAVQTDTAFQFVMKEYYVTITLYGPILALNRGPEAVLDLVESKMYNASEKMAKLLATDMYGDGGLGSISPITAVDGFTAAFDNGSTYTTYGGLTRSAIATGANNGINGYVATSVGTLTLPAMMTAYGACWFGRQRPDLLVSNQDVWNIVWNRLQVFERINRPDSVLASAGFPILNFNGVPYAVDQYAPSGTLWFMNTRVITLHISQAARYQFGFTGWKEYPSADVVAGQTLFLGDITVAAPRLNGSMSGITG